MEATPEIFPHPFSAMLTPGLLLLAWSHTCDSSLHLNLWLFLVSELDLLAWMYSQATEIESREQCLNNWNLYNIYIYIRIDTMIHIYIYIYICCFSNQQLLLIPESIAMIMYSFVWGAMVHSSPYGVIMTQFTSSRRTPKWSWQCWVWFNSF